MSEKVVGEKHDQGKVEFHLFPWEALRQVSRVLTKGAEKYTPGGWAHVPNARVRYFNAALRHLTVWLEGERNDPEWGLHHLAHASCDVLFLLALDLAGKFDGDGGKPAP